MDEVNFKDYAKWAVFYSCNWLTNDGDNTVQTKIYNKFNDGLHLMLGFASRMYLDSREGTVFGDYLRDYYSIKQAFFNSSQSFQPQLPKSSGTNGNVYARVMGAKISEDDYFDRYSNTPPSYSSSPNSYKTWTLVIPCTN